MLFMMKWICRKSLSTLMALAKIMVMRMCEQEAVYTFYLLNSLEQMNNAGEAVAILLAVEAALTDAILYIKSDSKIVIDGLTKNLHK
ncbi:hypothetical protein Hypma_003757 [Hypsizygus marmoreus]|uniref:RNase H type-1 domain-containing protein n=1 Tax=Hypsizygus marmoreus TaxID=39966 RepID=A0A369J7R4_HYPMA|nr:hypothetical protein Hypma_003757 [Hypsizygus marmoreus]